MAACLSGRQHLLNIPSFVWYASSLTSERKKKVYVKNSVHQIPSDVAYWLKRYQQKKKISPPTKAALEADG